MKKVFQLAMIACMASCNTDEEATVSKKDASSNPELQSSKFVSMGKAISKSESDLQIEEFRKTAKANETVRVFYSADVIKEMLEIKGAVGIAYFFGKNKDGKQILIMKALDENGNELSPISKLRINNNDFGGINGSIGPTCPPVPPCNEY